LEAVIKVGGSLAHDLGELKQLCRVLSRLAGKHSVLIVPGGGEFADAVRRLDSKLNLPSHVTHRMAVLAMDQYGLMLSALTPNSKNVETLDEAERVSRRKLLPILLASKLVLGTDMLEESWDVTSDSISAYIAEKLGVKKLLLVKDVDGVFDKNPKKHVDAKLLEAVGVKELSKIGGSCVDKYLPKLLENSGFDCYVVNGKHPSRVTRIIEGGEAACTKISAGK